MMRSLFYKINCSLLPDFLDLLLNIICNLIFMTWTNHVSVELVVPPHRRFFQQVQVFFFKFCKFFFVILLSCVPEDILYFLVSLFPFSSNFIPITTKLKIIKCSVKHIEVVFWSFIELILDVLELHLMKAVSRPLGEGPSSWIYFLFYNIVESRTHIFDSFLDLLLFLGNTRIMEPNEFFCSPCVVMACNKEVLNGNIMSVKEPSELFIRILLRQTLSFRLSIQISACA